MVFKKVVALGAQPLGAAAGAYFGGPVGAQLGGALGGIAGNLIAGDSGGSSGGSIGGGCIVNVQPGAWVNLYSGSGGGMKPASSSGSSGLSPSRASAGTLPASSSSTGGLQPSVSSNSYGGGQRRLGETPNVLNRTENERAESILGHMIDATGPLGLMYKDAFQDALPEDQKSMDPFSRELTPDELLGPEDDNPPPYTEANDLHRGLTLSRNYPAGGFNPN